MCQNCVNSDTLGPHSVSELLFWSVIAIIALMQDLCFGISLTASASFLFSLLFGISLRGAPPAPPSQLSNDEYTDLTLWVRRWNGEGDDHPPSYAEAKKIKSLTLHTHGVNCFVCKDHFSSVWEIFYSSLDLYLCKTRCSLEPTALMFWFVNVIWLK